MRSRAPGRTVWFLVGHSYGGGVVREYTHTYGSEVAGLVLAEIVSENQLIPMGPHAGRIGEDAKGLDIPKPHEDMNRSSSAPPESGQEYGGANRAALRFIAGPRAAAARVCVCIAVTRGRREQSA